MLAKDNLLASISSNRHRTFSHVVRYRTYLTPPSNPFREGKSRFQVLREVVLVVLVCTVALMAMSRLFCHRPIDHHKSPTKVVQRPTEALVRHATKGVSNAQALQERTPKTLFHKLRSEPKPQVGATKLNEQHVDSTTSLPGITKSTSKDTIEQMGSGSIANEVLSQSDYPSKTLRVQEGSVIPLIEDFHKVMTPLDTSNGQIINQVHPSDQNYVPDEREESQQAGTNSALVQIQTS